MATLKNTTVSDTGAIQLPSGTTAQRPVSPSVGQMRYNSTFKTVESYDGTRWKYTPDIIRNNLVLYLDAGEPSSYSGSGTSWNDLSGNGYNFTLTGTYTYQVHKGANCFNFDGAYSDANGAYRTGSITHNIAKQCTITVIYTSISNQNFNGCSRIFSCGENNTNNVDYSTYFGLPSCDETKHGLWMGGGGPQGFYVNSSTKSANDDWKFLTYSWSVGGFVKGYVNGIWETTTTGPTQEFNYAGISRMAVSINAALNIEHARARVAAVLMHNRQLTDTEIKQNYEALRGRFGL